jgi:hypothetical protein
LLRYDPQYLDEGQQTVWAVTVTKIWDDGDFDVEDDSDTWTVGQEDIRRGVVGVETTVRWGDESWTQPPKEEGHHAFVSRMVSLVLALIGVVVIALCLFVPIRYSALATDGPSEDAFSALHEDLGFISTGNQQVDQFLQQPTAQNVLDNENSWYHNEGRNRLILAGTMGGAFLVASAVSSKIGRKHRQGWIPLLRWWI